MFNIKGNISITNNEKKWNSGKHYNPEVISYVCPWCHYQISASTIIGCNIDEVIKNKLFDKRKDEDFVNKINNKYVSFIQKYENKCPKCNSNIDAEILIELKNGEISSYEICASDVMEFSLDSFLALGCDIYSHFNLLFLRWWRANRDIDVVIPFINEEYFELFFSIMKKTYSYDRFLSDDDNLILNTNPFNKLIFRKNHHVFSNKITLQQMYNNYCSKVMKDYQFQEYELNEKVLSEIGNCLYQVNNFAKRMYSNNKEENRIFDEIAKDNQALVCEGYFHAKFLAGVKKENTELFITSYNFGDIEGLQYETQCLNTIETNEYNRIIKIFETYPRIDFSKLKNKTK